MYSSHDFFFFVHTLIDSRACGIPLVITFSHVHGHAHDEQGFYFLFFFLYGRKTLR
jgi:hypothetical protein